MSTFRPAKPPLALIAGPTASGKSSLALALAEERKGTIINADSAQVYRDLRIVTARPTGAEEARAPHRLYGYRDAASPCSAAEWAADARAAIDEVHAAGGFPILVGGTGLYLRTLLDGIAPVPQIDPEIRTAVRAMSVAEAHGELAARDPSLAARLGPGDTSRVARALEVIRSTGRSLTEWQLQRTGGIGDRVSLFPLILIPPRDWLYCRCDARFQTMFDEGQSEVARLLERGLADSLPIMRAIGVAELSAFVRGEADAEATRLAGRQATRRYAKRQYTWFRHQPPPAWPRFEQALDEEHRAAALDAIVGPALIT